MTTELKEGLATRQRRRSRREVKRPDEDDDRTGGRSSDLTKMIPE
jgi:hypothetical protein